MDQPSLPQGSAESGVSAFSRTKALPARRGALQYYPKCTTQAASTLGTWCLAGPPVPCSVIRRDSRVSACSRTHTEIYYNERIRCKVRRGKGAWGEVWGNPAQASKVLPAAESHRTHSVRPVCCDHTCDMSAWRLSSTFKSRVFIGGGHAGTLCLRHTRIQPHPRKLASRISHKICTQTL